MKRKLLLCLLLLAPLGLYPFLRDSKAKVDDIKHVLPSPLTPDEHLVMGCFAIFPGQAFPGTIPWEPMRDIGQQKTRALEELAERDPVEFLQQCLDRYEKEVHEYQCIFEKQERVKGKLLDREIIAIHFRAKPFSVHMGWVNKPRGIIPIRTLYVEGENDNLLIVRPYHDLIPLKHVKIDHPDAQATSRFDITNFGMGKGAKNTLDGIRRAQENNTLYLTYEGITKVKEVGDRFCYKFIRAPFVGPEDDGVHELIIYIDQITHLQVGSVLLDTEGKLIAEYYFRDIDLHPKFNATQFTLKGL